MKLPAALLLLLALPGKLLASDTYIPQAAFSLSFSSVAGIDQDSVGNLYVLGLLPGATTYRVTSYSTPNLSPLFSFDTGLSSPAAFAVDASGFIDILDTKNGYNAMSLVRYANPGTFVSQTVISLGIYVAPIMYSVALDKVNSRVYAAYQYSYHPIYLECLGCGGPSEITKTTINQYGFGANLLLTTSMPGTDATPGSCYTPTTMTVDPQGNLYIADGYCAQVLQFAPAGTLTSSTLASQWTRSFVPQRMWTDSASNLYISENVCSPTGCQPGVVKLGSGAALQTSFVTNPPVGCATDARTLYLGYQGSQPFSRFILDGAPSVPAESAPLGMMVQHSSEAALSWQTSTDPDGDPVAYTVYLGTSPSQLSSMTATSLTSLTTTPLAFGVTYYWQVVAQDSYETLPLLNVQAPVVSFNLNLLDGPPGAFSVIAGTGTAVTRATSVQLAWSPSVDAYGDSLVYDLYWSTASLKSAPVVTTTATAWAFGGLSYGTTYYWSVRARDPYGATTLMSGGAQQTYDLIFENTPPFVPVYLSTASVYSVHTLSPSISLSWQPSTDPDGDPILYQLQVKTSTAVWPSIALGAATSFTINPQLGTTYSWQVSAWNPYNAVSTGAWTSFYVVFVDTPPSMPAVLTGTGTVSTHALPQQALLSWAASIDTEGDPVGYRVYVGAAPGALALAQDSASANFLLQNPLFGATYYWEVSAYDPYGGASTSAVQSLLFQFQDQPPSTVVYLSTASSYSLHMASPSITVSWHPAVDAYGDPLNYDVFFGSGPAGLAQVATSTSTSAQLPFPLYGTTYYWQVSAIDPYGAASTAPVQSFSAVFVDSAPGAFSVMTGTGTLMTRTTAEVLAWTAAPDIYGDPLSYSLRLSTNPAFMPIVQISSMTTYTLNVAFGTTYYWSATASDPFGATTTLTGGTQSFLPLFLNQPPQVPNVISPFSGAPVVKTMANNVIVSWQEVGDPEGDPITYTAYLGNSLQNMVPLASITQAAVGSATALALKPLATTPPTEVSIDSNTVTLSLMNLAYYQNYYFQVSASNPYGAVTMTPVANFSLASLDGFPNAYNYPNPFNPNRGGTNIVFNAPPSGYAQATVEIYSEWQALVFKQDYFNIPPGVSQIQYNGRDRYGRALFNGSYICRVTFSGPSDKQVFYLLVVK